MPLYAAGFFVGGKTIDHFSDWHYEWLDVPTMLLGTDDGASQVIIDARVLGAKIIESGVTAEALEAYDDEHCEEISALVLRNRGAFGSLVPTFEARLEGPHAYLNDGLYLSSNPGIGDGGVALTFHQSTN